MKKWYVIRWHNGGSTYDKVDKHPFFDDAEFFYGTLKDAKQALRDARQTFKLPGGNTVRVGCKITMYEIGKRIVTR